MTEDTDTTPPTESINSTDYKDRKYFYKLITLEEAALLCAYPITMILGWLVSVANPTETYFTNKKNLFNVLFVRQGWLWTTIAFVLIALTQHSNNNSSISRQQFSRYIIATIWWILFTQWCFGLPLMDRVFVLTGGSCEGIAGIEGLNITSAACKAKGGLWTGGYDPSGHSFILVHSSLFLWFETLPVIQRLKEQQMNLTFSVKFVLVLLALWWWMLLMTSIYFHSFFEKLAGLGWGFLEIMFVYIYSRVNTQIAMIFGNP